MKYLNLYESFSKKIITYKGMIGQILSEDNDKVKIRIFKPNITMIVNKEDVKPQVKCLSQCDKRVVGSGNDRYIKCYYCGKEERFR